MKLLTILLLFLLSGCATPKMDTIKSYLELQNKHETKKQEELSEIKRLFKLYPPDTQAFIKAFQKVGYDPFLIAKLIKDNEPLCVKKFVIKNSGMLLLSGSLNEIIKDDNLSVIKRYSTHSKKKMDKLIKHIELNYKLYMRLQHDLSFKNKRIQKSVPQEI